MTCGHPQDNFQKILAPERPSVSQLRREAGKARKLGDAAFGVGDRRQLHEIAAALDREAAMMEVALAAKDLRELPSSDPSGMDVPRFTGNAKRSAGSDF
jgi:hypothetical protein